MGGQSHSPPAKSNALTRNASAHSSTQFPFTLARLVCRGVALITAERDVSFLGKMRLFHTEHTLLNQYQTLNVELGERSYPIHIGAGLLDQPDLLAPYLSRQVVLVTNTTVAALYLDTLKALVARAAPAAAISEVVIADGEQFKNLETLNSVFDQMLRCSVNRNATVIALGGGVVGDIAGFAAACYQRGVPFIQVPTTLLSQVDSSVGGKTGVNHALGKNMIGAFYQPQTVLIDTEVLASLPSRELAAGLAEVVKYGLIADAAFFEWLEDNLDGLLAKDSAALAYAIYRSCAIKAEVVAEDEKESGRRAILNLGHTYGHAIEAHLGYGSWLHGEAVAAGMVLACELSVHLGWLSAEVLGRARKLLARAGLPIEPPAGMGRRDFEKYMQLDKKVLDGRIRLVLLTALGEAVVTDDFDRGALNRQLDHFDAQ